jgi:hypothetical protein
LRFLFLLSLALPSVAVALLEGAVLAVAQVSVVALALDHALVALVVVDHIQAVLALVVDVVASAAVPLLMRLIEAVLVAELVALDHHEHILQTV